MRVRADPTARPSRLRCTRSGSCRRSRFPPVRKRVEAIKAAGYNTFLLRSRDIFLDMLTDSGTNAMSDNQLAAMMVADDAYAGCESFYKMAAAVKDVLGFEYMRAGPPGPRGGAPAGQDNDQARRLRHNELPLHHHQGPLRDRRRRPSSSSAGTRPSTPRAPIPSRATWTSTRCRRRSRSTAPRRSRW